MESYQRNPTPLLWGVDDAGGPHGFNSLEMDILKELGCDFRMVHYLLTSPSLAEHRDHIARIDSWCVDGGMRWLNNTEISGWPGQLVDETGYDWMNRPDGRRFLQFPDSIMGTLRDCKVLAGVVFDEAEHTQNCRCLFADVDQPHLWIPDGNLAEAADNFTAAARAMRDHYARFNLPLFTEHVFPILFHSFARAGYTATPKILKESWSPAYIATAMGAALQYNTPLWLNADLWGVDGYPGHSVAEYESSLLMGYLLGADCIYTENLGYDHQNKGQGSLAHFTNGTARLTDYGRAKQRFRREYVPQHPRHYSIRDLKPQVAIIRRDDACWGQSNSWLKDQLFGNPAWPSTPATEAWLRIWHLLSNGVIPPHALSWNAPMGRPHQLFCPLNGVVVFDDRVEYERLRGIPVLFVSGLGVSVATQEALLRCVADGATCIGPLHLLPELVARTMAPNAVRKEGSGCWVSTTDFLADHVRRHVAPVLPTSDAITYHFGDTMITLRPTGNSMDNIEGDTSVSKS